MEPSALRVAAYLFIGGAIASLVGACWPPYRQWYAPLDEGLRVIAAHPVGWRCIHAGFLVGNTLTIFAFAALAYGLGGRPGGLLATMAACAYLVAALAWFGNIAVRLTVTPWAAAELVATQSIPESFAQWRQFAGVLFVIFSAFGYVSVAAAGGAVLGARLAPTWVGWSLVGWGLSAGLVVGHNVPVMIYVPGLVVLGAFLW